MKIFTITLLALFTSSVAMAQLQFESLAFGPKAGVSFVDLVSGDLPSDEIKSRIGYHGGIFGEGMITDNFGAQVELLFSNQGGAEDNSIIDSKIRIIINYLNIPILAKYQIVDGVFVYAGPQIGFVLSSSGKVVDGPEKGRKFDNNDTNFLDLSFVFGGSYEIQDGLIAEARFVPGITSIDNDSDNPFKIRNQVIQFSIGYVLVRR